MTEEQKDPKDLPDQDQVDSEEVSNETVLDKKELPEHKTRAPKSREEHTRHNTTVKTRVDPDWKLLPNDERNIGTIPVFLGTRRDQYLKKVTMLKAWMERNAQISLLNDGRVSEASARPKINEYEELRARDYPDMSDEEFETYFTHFLSFNQDSVENEFYRNRRNYGQNWTNLTQFSASIQESDVVGRLPLADDKGSFSMSQLMVRDSGRSSKDPLTWDCLIRDSFVQVRLNRSDLLELGDLVSRIQNQVIGYTRALNGNSLTLARVAMYRVFWDHFISKVSATTIKGLNDFRTLGNVINFNNLNEIFASFICEVSPTGVPFTLYCTEDHCNWNDTQTIDATCLKHFDPDMLSDEAAAVIGNLRNRVRSYSPEEIAKLKSKQKWVEDNRLYFDNQQQYLVVGPGTVTEAFACFDIFMELLGPRIEKLREEYIDDKLYEQQLSQMMDTHRSMEFIHWVSELHVIEKDGTEKIFTRKDDPVEFTKGIFTILNNAKNTQLGKDLVEFVMKNGPNFTSTVVGVPNYACPKCHQSSGKHSGVSGITPIDPFSCFFIQSRLEILKRQVEMSRADVAL